MDSGVREGDTISPYYDPMIAKLIVHGEDRDQALARMSQALSECRIVGLANNIAFLRRVVESRPFAAAELDTGLIERHQEELFPPAQPASKQALALAATALLTSEAGETAANDPWASTSGWRMNGVLQRTLDFADETHAYPVAIAYNRTGWAMRHEQAWFDIRLLRHDGQHLTIALAGETVRGVVVRDVQGGDVFHIFSAGTHVALAYNDPLAHAGQAEAEGGRLTAPMPGKIVAVLVDKGRTVEKGEPLLIMEAMKMEHTIAAPAAGTVEELLYAVGDQVAEGAQLLAFKAALTSA